MSLKDKYTRDSWYREEIIRLRTELDDLPAEALNVPSSPGGWWHVYVCPEHHTELLFDPAQTETDTFRCQYGCVLHGEPFRGAWLVFKHQGLARYALQASAVYAATGENRYARLAVDIVLEYARLYPRFPIHPEASSWMLKGRVFHQALTESIWASVILRAVLLLRDEGYAFAEEHWGLVVQFASMLEANLTESHRVLVFEKRTPESNYTAWLFAALCAVYAVTDNERGLRSLIEAEGGFAHHLSIGVYPDRFEHEGSVYYHVFVLRAYWIAAEMAGRFGIDLYRLRGSKGQSIEDMADLLAQLANVNGRLPALHDGPYERQPYAREIAEVMEQASRKFGKPEYEPMLAEAYRQLYGGTGGRQGLEAVLFGAGERDLLDKMPERPSLLLPDSGYAIGRLHGNELGYLLDFGPHGGSHGHYDKLHLSLYHSAAGTFITDPGMVPYGSAMRKDWYAATISHHTVTVDGKPQAPHTGKCLRFEADGSGRFHLGWFRSDEAYPGCVINRHVLLASDWLLDWVEVTSDRDCIFDLPYYTGCQTIEWKRAETSSVTNPASESGAALPSFIEYPRLVTIGGVCKGDGCSGVSSVSCIGEPDGGESGIALSTTLLVLPSSSVTGVLAPGTADNPAKKQAGWIHRQQGRSALFISVHRSGREPTELVWLKEDRVTIQADGQTVACRLDPDYGLRIED
ncbi:alginate lyase family protein [Paenibacillus mesophilus]|uniref:heparinase II/III domain-containing protein n=1 Tax=Paenibacillus mesophilus TaxID=2582849 RepID=UPI00110E63F8|nr:heparinase II/III family protein [Paenibacillus mesophilus]TMV50752.1 alginate lyase family protein [Paenibacillus mesophilus]